MKVKIRASLKPESKDKQSTIGSVTNMTKGLQNVLTISCKENLSLKDFNSLGP